MADAFYHEPVLLEACLKALDIRPDGIYVDCTLGGGGHARAILGRLGPDGLLFGVDQDADAVARASRPSEEGLALTEDPRFRLIDSNFSELRRFLQWQGVQQVQGILADLGVSSHQLDQSERGFAFRFEEALLDMRMDQRHGITAAQWLAEAEEKDIAEVLFLYGEIRQARRLARDLVLARAEQGLSTTGQLKVVALKNAGAEKPSKFTARVFQAIRIHLNHEMESLKALLEHSAYLLSQGGRLVVMSYHSLEDRMVKQYIQHGNVEGLDRHDLYGNPLRPFDPVKGRFLKADPDENARNPRARSARLRVGIRNANQMESLATELAKIMES